MLKYHVEPDVGLDLAEHMGMRASCDAFYRSFNLREGFEEVHDSFRNSGLFPLLVDIHRLWVEEVNLAVCEVFFFGFAGTLREQSGVHDEDGADLYLRQEVELLRCHYINLYISKPPQKIK